MEKRPSGSMLVLMSLVGPGGRLWANTVFFLDVQFMCGYKQPSQPAQLRHFTPLPGFPFLLRVLSCLMFLPLHLPLLPPMRLLQLLLPHISPLPLLHLLLLVIILFGRRSRKKKSPQSYPCMGVKQDFQNSTIIPPHLSSFFTWILLASYCSKS